MKTLLVLIIFILSLSSFSKEYLTVINSSSEEFSGELIEHYEDRWFYEAQNDLTQNYILLFNSKSKTSKFKVINIDEIISLKSVELSESEYEKYLIKNNIIFKNRLIQDAHILTGNEGHHKFERMFGNFAWDISKVDEDGKTFLENPFNLFDYYVFNEKVISPISGKVVGLSNNEIDNTADPLFEGNLDGLKNNYLTIKVNPEFYLSVVHFKKGTIPLRIGDNVKVGDELGRVGNSGVSYVPHLHYTLYIYSKDLKRFISVPALHKD
jgi:hypothetical protein